MKRFCLFLFVFIPFLLSAQCECPSLPDDQTDRTVVNVSTVGELQAALQECNSNNGNYTILLEDGEYVLTNNLLYISQNMVNLTIRSVSGDRDAVIIRGQGMGGNVNYIFNVAADNFTAADMTIGWIGYHAIQIHAEHDADNCLIQNVRFVNTKEQMLKVSGNASATFSDGGVVQCCWFEFPDGVAYQYYTGGIDAHRAKDWEVRHNTFKHIRSPDNGLAEHAIHFWSDSESTLVENNLIINCDRGIGFGLGSSSHQGGMIRNNFVHTSRDVGIGLESSPNTKVYHNTVITDNYFNSIEYRFEETVNVHIVNNLTNEAIASRNGGTGNVESNFETMDLSIFTEAANNDYHLSTTIPQIVDAGIILAEAEEDYDCHSRTTDGMPDIGADEFNSTITSISSPVEYSDIKIYPNPATEMITIEFENTFRDVSNILLSDPLGQILYNKTVNIGDVKISIDISNFPSGVYYLVILNKESAISKIITKL
jgi:hypothetical protein